MSGLEAVEKQLSEVKIEPTLRFDSEYFKKVYDEALHCLNKCNTKTICKLVKWVTQGPNPVFSEDGNIPCLTGRNIAGGRVNYHNADYIDEATYNELSRFQLSVGDTLITLKGRGSIGKIGYVTETTKAIFSRNIGIIRPRGKVNAAFLNAYIMSKYGQLLIARGETGGTGQATLTTSYLSSMPVPLFSNMESAIDEVLAKSEIVLKNSQGMYAAAEAYLLAALGMNNFTPSKEPVAVKSFSESFGASGRLDAEYYQRKYEDMLQRLSGFKCKRLGDIVSITKSIEPGSDYYGDEGVPFVRVSDITKFGIQQPEIRIPANLTELRPKKDTILLSKDGSVGIAYKVEEDLDCITSGALLHLAIKCGVLPDYLTLVLNSIVVQFQAERDAGGSIIQHWKPSEIEDVVIPVLDTVIQQKIADDVQQSFALRRQSERLLDAAKRAVEITIEDGENAAIKYMEDRKHELQ